MFSGIVIDTGKIHNIYKKKNNSTIEIKSNIKFSKKDIGSSISCSGVCLTLVSFKSKICRFFLSLETLNRTNFKYCKKGDLINLEKSLKFGKRLSGHFVQGHVDTTCRVGKITHIGKSWLLDIVLPKKYNDYIVYKVSISVNGVSLTIATIDKNIIDIWLIPHTLKHTTFKDNQIGDYINVETDIVGKYIENFQKSES